MFKHSTIKSWVNRLQKLGYDLDNWNSIYNLTLFSDVYGATKYLEYTHEIIFYPLSLLDNLTRSSQMRWRFRTKNRREFLIKCFLHELAHHHQNVQMKKDKKEFRDEYSREWKLVDGEHDKISFEREADTLANKWYNLLGLNKQ